LNGIARQGYFAVRKMESAGFKEWSLVCDALGRGRQSVIWRKGGIAEGRGGFSFRHREFFCFQRSSMSRPSKCGLRRLIFLRPAARSQFGGMQEWSGQYGLNSLAIAEALAPLHVLSAEVVRERFGYQGDGLNVAFVRVFEISPVWVLQNEKRFNGCRSWMDLPPSPETEMRAMLDETIHDKMHAQFDQIVSSSLAKSKDPVTKS
jgi:hypothetical protein